MLPFLPQQLRKHGAVFFVGSAAFVFLHGFQLSGVAFSQGDFRSFRFRREGAQGKLLPS